MNIHLAKEPVICVVLAVLLAASPRAQAEAGAKTDLPNFHAVHKYLYRGGEPSKAGLARLKEMGVTTVIDLRGHKENVQREAAWARALGMQSINLPMSSKAPTASQVDTFMKTIKEARDGRRGPVFVHCAHGSDRTGCMIGIWRVSQEGYSYDQAYREMRKYYFTPKFVDLSGAVRHWAERQERQTN